MAAGTTRMPKAAPKTATAAGRNDASHLHYRDPTGLPWICRMATWASRTHRTGVGPATKARRSGGVADTIDQTDGTNASTLLTDAVVAWNTVSHHKALD